MQCLVKIDTSSYRQIRYSLQILRTIKCTHAPLKGFVKASNSAFTKAIQRVFCSSSKLAINRLVTIALMEMWWLSNEILKHFSHHISNIACGTSASAFAEILHKISYNRLQSVWYVQILLTTTKHLTTILRRYNWKVQRDKIVKGCKNYTDPCCSILLILVIDTLADSLTIDSVPTVKCTGRFL